MYRSTDQYEMLAKIVIDLYIDYNIQSLPINEKVVCNKFGVALVPYSAFSYSDRKILIKQSVYGFYLKNNIAIYYNDISRTIAEQRFTIFHELKHYICEDEDDEKDDLADFFSRYFMCPIPYLMLKKIDTPDRVVSFCNVSISVANNVCSNIRNRRTSYGEKLFDYEIRLIEQIDPILLETNSQKE